MALGRRVPETTEEAVVQIYDILVGIEASLGRICQNCQREEQRIDAQEKRIGALEAWKNRIVGGAAVTGIILGYIATRAQDLSVLFNRKP